MRTTRQQPGRGHVAGIAGGILAALLVLQPAPLAQFDGGRDRWVGTWATAAVVRPRPPLPGGPPQGGGGGGGQAPLAFTNQTLRQIVRVSLGGERVRVVLSNAFGTLPLAVGAAHVSRRASAATIEPGSDRPLTFNGRPGVTIAPGAVAFSDPVALSVPALSDLAIDLYLPETVEATASPFTTHTGAFQTSYVSPAGDHTGAAEIPVDRTTTSWFFLARVEVAVAGPATALVAFGDSITDGTRSTPDTNNRWPDHLAARLMAGSVRMGVLNAGISGNRVLSDGSSFSALARFDRDVLASTGVTHVVVLLGTNDIGVARENPVPTADDIIGGHAQLIARARAQRLAIYGATLAPFEGANYWTPEGEAKRQALNEWIRTSGAYDAVIDFDAVVRDATQPTRIRAEYDSGDHLHPNDAGYVAMGNAIDLALFTTDQRATAAAR